MIRYIQKLYKYCHWLISTIPFLIHKTNSATAHTYISKLYTFIKNLRNSSTLCTSFFPFKIESVREKNSDQGNKYQTFLVLGAVPHVPSGRVAANTLGLPGRIIHHEHSINLGHITDSWFCLSSVYTLNMMHLCKVHFRVAAFWSSGKGEFLTKRPKPVFFLRAVEAQGCDYASLPWLTHLQYDKCPFTCWSRLKTLIQKSQNTLSCLPITPRKHTHLGTPP